MTHDDELLSADRQARAEALDVSRSFIVQAPAGSGKTELLIQRYLRLLATVENPEEILAITFTRKAAAEMRLRVLEALRRAAHGETPDEPHLQLTASAAADVLGRDAALGWKLITHSRRMRIQTLDSLNASLARMRPLTQTNAASTAVVDAAALGSLYAEAAAATLDWLGDDSGEGRAVEEVLLHVDNNTGRFIAYLSRMLKTRDQWLPFVRSGVNSGSDAEALRRTLEGSLQRLVANRLHALQRLVPMDLAAEFLALGTYAAENLLAAGKADDAICNLRDVLGLPDIPLTDDVAGLENALLQWQAIAELLLTKSGSVRKQVNKNQGFPPQDDGQKQAMIAMLESLAQESKFATCMHNARSLPPLRYRAEQWSVLLALFRVLPVAVGEFRRLCLLRGATDHIEIAIGAGEALGTADSPGDVALLLDYQVRHILVDEMQDTSKAQYRMLEAFSGGWQQGDGRTLFCVGDPMQSIYRFRNAEVAQFLLAREKGIGSIALEPLILRRNFRSGERLVDWFNEVFPSVLPQHNDPVNGAVAYSEAVAVDKQKGRGDYHLYPLFGSSVAAEAEQSLDIIERLLEESEDDTIAVLVRSRTQLPTLLTALRDAGIGYQAVDIDRLSDLPEIIDALALTRALVHVGDRVAWLGLLRSPWIGLDWTDLHHLVFDATRATVLELLRDEQRRSSLSAAGRRAVERALRILEPYLHADRSAPLHERVERAWYALGGPALTRDANAVANVEHFFTAVAKLETGGTLADVAQLMDQLDETHVSTTVAARLQIMTMHKAKGLQFDHVLLHALGRYTSGHQKSVLSWFDLPDEHGNEVKIISPVGREDELESDPIHRFIDRTEIAKDVHEQGRLLYVACTRARKSLHLIGNVSVSDDASEYRAPHAGSLLKLLWPAVEADYARAFGAATAHGSEEDRDAYVAPMLRRFEREWLLPEFAELPGAPATAKSTNAVERVDYDWVGPDARLAGTIVHRWLQSVAEGRMALSASSIADSRETSQRWLRQLGAAEELLDPICNRVEQALSGVADDPRGQWLVAGDGDAELALQGVVDGRIESIIIDRIRVDDDGAYWIVDYKTSSHEGGSLEGFLQAECDRYRDQLRRYATIYRAYSGTRARCALYFPLLQQFVEVDV